MADITMCKGEMCPLKEDCYRYLAKANPLWQAYFTKSPYNKEKNECDSYWKHEKCNMCGMSNGAHKKECDGLKLRVHFDY